VFTPCTSALKIDFAIDISTQRHIASMMIAEVLKELYNFSITNALKKIFSARRPWCIQRRNPILLTLHPVIFNDLLIYILSSSTFSIFSLLFSSQTREEHAELKIIIVLYDGS
jgi:hypothetical protein